MNDIQKAIDETRYLEGQIAFPKNGTTHVISNKELKSLLEQVVEEIKTEIRMTSCASDTEKNHNENYLKWRIEKRVEKWWKEQSLTFNED